MEIIEKIKAEMAAFDAKRKELTEQLRKDFPALLAPLFEKYPSVKNVYWTQYTPYFNDGDTCEFSANVSYAELNHEIDQDEEDDDEENETEKSEVELPENAEDEFQEVLSSIDESFYKDLFGDHVEVIVNRDGTIETEEYEHE